MTLHSSLAHEALHGHPFKNSFFNAVLVFPQLSLWVPYLRFKDLHQDHHRDEYLIDPYDDPESNFLDLDIWVNLPLMIQKLLIFNNTLLGRMLVGPIIGQLTFMGADLKKICTYDRRVMQGWLLHLPATGIVILWIIYFSAMPLLIFICGSYFALSLLKVRTFLEHRAHEESRARTAIIEGQDFFAFLFLNNSFHLVHHMHPKVAWYRLPTLFRSQRDHYLAQNDAYTYKNYTEIFAAFFLRNKDSAPHPLWSKASK